MKAWLVLYLIAVLSALPEWLTNMDNAKKIAHEQNRMILLNFSGSDWCGPCIKMRKEIFSQEPFLTYADAHLVLVKADFPRLKKNQLDADQVKLNEILAEKYNPTGKFPFTLLLDASGNIIKEWDGYTTTTPANFVSELSKFVHE